MATSASRSVWNSSMDEYDVVREIDDEGTKEEVEKIISSRVLELLSRLEKAYAARVEIDHFFLAHIYNVTQDQIEDYFRYRQTFRVI